MEDDDEFTIYDFPGKRGRSVVWKYFGFIKIDKDKPPIKENLHLNHVICRLCKKRYAYKGKEEGLGDNTSIF